MKTDTTNRVPRRGARLWAAAAAFAMVVSVIGVVTLPTAAGASPGAGIAVGTANVHQVLGTCVSCFSGPQPVAEEVFSLQLSGLIPIGGTNATSMILRTTFDIGQQCSLKDIIGLDLRCEPAIVSGLISYSTWNPGGAVDPGPSGPPVSGLCAANGFSNNMVELLGHLALMTLPCTLSVAGGPATSLTLHLSLVVPGIEGGWFGPTGIGLPVAGTFTTA